MAVFAIIMPKLGESIIEATITKWLKQVGEEVAEEDPIVEIATDKVDSEIPSPIDGVIAKLNYQEGDVVPVGAVIAVVNMDGEEGVEEESQEAPAPAQAAEAPAAAAAVEEDSVSPAPADFSSADRFYSPLVKNIAKTENISLDELNGISGSGKYRGSS